MTTQEQTSLSPTPSYHSSLVETWLREHGFVPLNEGEGRWRRGFYVVEIASSHFPTPYLREGQCRLSVEIQERGIVLRLYVPQPRLLHEGDAVTLLQAAATLWGEREVIVQARITATVDSNASRLMAAYRRTKRQYEQRIRQAEARLATAEERGRVDGLQYKEAQEKIKAVMDDLAATQYEMERTGNGYVLRFDPPLVADKVAINEPLSGGGYVTVSIPMPKLYKAWTEAQGIPNVIHSITWDGESFRARPRDAHSHISGGNICFGSTESEILFHPYDIDLIISTLRQVYVGSVYHPHNANAVLNFLFSLTPMGGYDPQGWESGSRRTWNGVRRKLEGNEYGIPIIEGWQDDLRELWRNIRPYLRQTGEKRWAWRRIDFEF